MFEKLKNWKVALALTLISSSVFMRNYFNPAWIGDLGGRASEGAETILRNIA